MIHFNNNRAGIYEEKKALERFKRSTIENKLLMFMAIGTELKEQRADLYKVLGSIDKIISLRMLVDDYKNNNIMKHLYINKYLEALGNCKETLQSKGDNQQMEQITINRAEYEALKAKIKALNDTVDSLNSYSILLMSPEQASKEMGLNIDLTRGLMQRGYIPSLKIGRGIKTTRNNISQFYSNYQNYDLSDLDHPQQKQF